MRALPSHTTIKVARAGCRIDREREREGEKKEEGDRNGKAREKDVWER